MVQPRQQQERQELYDQRHFVRTTPHATGATTTTGSRRTREDHDGWSHSSTSQSAGHDGEHFLGIRMEFPTDLLRRRPSKPPLTQRRSASGTTTTTSSSGILWSPHSSHKQPVVATMLAPASSSTRTSSRTSSTPPPPTHLSHQHHDHRTTSSNGVARPSRSRSSASRRNVVRSTPPLLTPEQRQLQELYLDARRHEAIVAHVTTTTPVDLEKLTYKLPAAKLIPPQTSTTTTTKPKLGAGSGWRCTATTMKTHGPGGGAVGPKTTRASAAAALALRQAEPLHDYDYQLKADNKRAFPGDSQSVDSRNRGWKSFLLPRKVVSRSAMLVVPFEI